MASSRPRYFTFEEMTRTSTGLPNIPGWEEIENLQRLAFFLDDVRESFGKPVRVNCAFRSAAVNAKVGGVATSAHLHGFAADVCAFSGKEADNRALLSKLRSYISSIDQLIVYYKEPGNRETAIRFIHVGLRNGTPRSQELSK